MTNKEIARFFNTTRPFIQGNTKWPYAMRNGYFIVYGKCSVKLQKGAEKLPEIERPSIFEPQLR